MVRIVLPVALLIAGLALLAAVGLGPADFRIPPGTPILLVAAAATWRLRSHSAPVIGLVAAGLVAVVSFQRSIGAELMGAGGPAVAVLRWIELVSIAISISAAAVGLLRSRRSATRSKEPTTTGRQAPLAQIIGVLVLCAVGAELLAAYGENTGDPGQIAFALVFFGALYGAPALLARELVRRRGWGWPSMLLLFGALGVAQACLIDQSLFSVDYQGYDGWEQSRQATLIPALGISAFSALNFVVGHVIYSFGAPVAIVEAWRPHRAHQPWLGTVGIVFAAAAYLATAAMIISDPESRSGSPVQLMISGLLIVSLILSASLLGRRRRARSAPPSGPLRTLPLWLVTVGVLVLIMVGSLAEETWIGFWQGLSATLVVGTAVLILSRRTEWSIRHTAAVGVAFLLVRGGLAFTYFPLLGEVAAVPKYAHNVVMILIVLGAGWIALRPRSAADLPGSGQAPSTGSGNVVG